MTGPQIWDYGQGSADYDRQLAQFNATRDQYYQSLLNGFNRRIAPQQVSNTPTLASQQQGQPVTSDWSDPDLLGAARFWGIPEEVARHMPKDQLVTHLNELRQASRPEEDTFGHRVGAAADMLISIPEMFGIGAGEALTGLAQHLPLIGPSLSRLKGVHEADMFLRELEESVRSSTPEDFQHTLSATNIIGNIAGTWYPAAGAWKLAGKPVGWVASPLARGALQGAGSGWLLDGGSDHPGSAVAGGAVLGGLGLALSPYIEAAATKLSKHFLSPAMIENVQGEAWPINRMGRSTTRGEYPPDYLENWDVAQMGPKPSREQYADFQRNALETLGGVADQTRRSERQFFPSGYPFKGMNEQTAEVAALQMNKPTAIVESPLLPKIVAQTAPDDFSVVQALGTSNPGGSNIVEGILDPASIARWNEIGHVGFAQRKGRLAAIISDQPVTDEMISAFEKHGMYPGQQVLTEQGLPSTIQRIADDGTATLTHDYSPLSFSRHVGELAPQMSSPGVHAVPAMWEHFQAYADAQAAAAQHAMGGALNLDQLAAIRTQNIPHYMEQFLDDAGIVSEGDRARIKNYFNHQWVTGFAAGAPEEAAMNLGIRAEAEHVAVAHPPTPVGALDRLADTRGYVAIPDGEGGWRLRNAAGGVGGAVSPVEMSFQDLESAQTWLKKINRSMADITPPVAVPLEVAGGLYREPQQLPNTNDKLIETVVQSIHEHTAENGGIPTVPPEEVAEAAASGNWGKLINLRNRASRFTPWRPLVANVSTTLREHVGDDFGLAHDSDLIDRLRVHHNNDMTPFINELADVLSTGDIGHTKRMVNGEWMRTWAIKDPAIRLARAQAAGWSQGEIDALDRFSALTQRFIGDDVTPELRSLIRSIAEKQSIPALAAQAWENPTTSEAVAAWQTHAAEHGLNVRELDPRVFGESLIRSVLWKQNIGPEWEMLNGKWSNLANQEGIGPFAQIMQNHLKMMREGYNAQDDLALDAVHKTMQVLLGKSFTRTQAKELVNFGMNTSHMAYLGYRTHVMARDFLQLLFAVPRAGTDLLSVMGRVTTDAAYRQHVWSNALAGDAIQLAMPHRVSPGALGGEMELASAGMAPENMSQRMRMLSSLKTFLTDITPDVLKGSSESITKPLYLYGKQQEWMRAMVYQAGFEKAERALAVFAQEGAGGNLDKLMADSGARTYDAAWREEFKRIVGTGDHQRAANFLGRQLADATQFKYGLTESPAVGRSTTGKLAMQFGSFQIQYIHYIRESLANDFVDRGASGILFSNGAKTLYLFGAVSAALNKAQDETGWHFNYMNPFAIGWAGGPAISMGMGLLQGVKASANAMFDPSNAGIDRGLAAGGQVLGTMVSAMNPVSGLYNTVAGLGSALNDSPRPGQAIGRLLVTGERGALPDILQTVRPGDVQPVSSPLRQGGWQLPNIPQLTPVYPFGVSGGSDSGIQVPPAVVPAPGGGAESYRPLPTQSEDLIPFTLHPQPGMASGYSPDDVKATIVSLASGSNEPAPQARFFAPDELQFLHQVVGVPLPQAVELFRGFMRDKLSRSAHDSSGVPPGYDQPSFAGNGTMF